MNQKTGKFFRRGLWTLIGLVVVALLVLPKLNLTSGEAGEDESGQQAESAGLSVEAYVPGSREFTNQIRTTGSLLAEDEIYIVPERSGRITELNIREGEEVVEGERILKLNDADLQASLRRITHDIALSEVNLERQEKLLESDAGTREAYDEAQNRVNILKAERDELQAEIDKTEIRAPFNGVIGFKNVSPGSYVTSSTTISTLQKIDPIRIEFSVPERYRGQLSNGQNIEFQVEGVDDRIQGEIYAIQPRVESETRTIGLRARAENPEGLLLPGAFANISLELERHNNAILIPSESLLPELEGYYVFTYSDGKAERTPVEVQQRTDTEVVINNGITPVDTVITTGLLQLRDGMPVRLSSIQNSES